MCANHGIDLTPRFVCSAQSLPSPVPCRKARDDFNRPAQARAAARGARSLIIDVKELYDTLCKRPVVNSWMIFCCNAMRAEMTETDNLMFDYSKDTLPTVNYKLPRDMLT